MEKNIILLDKVETTIDANGVAHIMGTLDGQAFEIGRIENATDYSAVELHERVDLYLRINEFGIKPAPVEEPKPKRKYTKRVNLGLASEYGKVTLTLAQPIKKKITVYNLYIKGTDKFVYKLDEKGIYVTNGKKTPPIAFTAADIKMIKNIDDFDVVKFEKETKYVKNKIAV